MTIEYFIIVVAESKVEKVGFPHLVFYLSMTYIYMYQFHCFYFLLKRKDVRVYVVSEYQQFTLHSCTLQIFCIVTMVIIVHKQTHCIYIIKYIVANLLVHCIVTMVTMVCTWIQMNPCWQVHSFHRMYTLQSNLWIQCHVCVVALLDISQYMDKRKSI